MGKFNSKIQKIKGNSFFIYLPLPIIRGLDLRKGEKVILREKENKILIEKIKR